jgi:hypothetical protein
MRKKLKKSRASHPPMNMVASLKGTKLTNLCVTNEEGFIATLAQNQSSSLTSASVAVSASASTYCSIGRTWFAAGAAACGARGEAVAARARDF